MEWRGCAIVGRDIPTLISNILLTMFLLNHRLKKREFQCHKMLDYDVIIHDAFMRMRYFPSVIPKLLPRVSASMICIILVAGHGVLLEEEISSQVGRYRYQQTACTPFLLIPTLSFLHTARSFRHLLSPGGSAQGTAACLLRQVWRYHPRLLVESFEKVPRSMSAHYYLSK